MKDQELVNYWLSTREQERGQNRTLSEYRSELKRFAAYLGDTPLLGATKAQVRLFLNERQKQGAAPATRRRTLAAIRSFYEFLVGEDTLDANPTAGIAKPKLPERLTKTLGIEQVRTIVETRPQHYGKLTEFYYRRDPAIVQLAFSTGLRRAELASIRLDDVDFRHNSINVIGKGDKERVVFFDAEAMKLLNQYLKIRPNSLFLFCTSTGRQLCVRQVWVIVKKTLKRAGAPGSTHTLRHSFGTHMYRNGADIHTVQRLMGHSNISTTQRYVHLDRDDLKAAYDRVRPSDPF